MNTTNIDTGPFTLVSHPLCPYVQRAVIVLAEKGVRFDRRYIDLADKPEWFEAISPLGKVPLLIIGRDDEERGQVLFESAAICEYLDETQQGRLLHPADPLIRARHRGWVEFGSSLLNEIWKLEIATDQAIFHTQRQVIADRLQIVERALETGPWFAGEHFCMVDAVFAPVFRYFDVFDEIVDLQVFGDAPKLTAWRRALARRPSVIDAVPSDYAARLRAFLAAQDAYLLRATEEGMGRRQ